jgi:alkylation response protein AidB-like acyl-CoA dehydrogenase
LLGVTVPRAWGGAGRDYVAYALALEALARESAVVAVIASVNNSLVAEPLAQFGTDAQKHAWLERLATGRALGAFALSEEHAGTDAANQQTRATFDGTGHRISGRKVWVANAEAADVVIVFAATQPDLEHRGITAFLVPLDTGHHDTRAPTRWACADSGASISSSMTCTSIRARSSGRLAPDSRSRDSTAAGSRSLPRRLGWARQRSTRRWRTRSTGWRSARPSRTTRPSSGCSPTSPPTSMRPAC